MADETITLHVPDEIYNQIKHQAEQSHRPIEAYLGERLALWLFSSRPQTDQPAVSGKRNETLQHAIEEIEAAFARAGAEHSNEIPAELMQAIIGLPTLSDDALWRAARTRISQRASARLQMLHEKRQREGLEAAEAEEAARLTRQYERAMFIRAHAAALLKDRGYDVSTLLAST